MPSILAISIVARDVKLIRDALAMGEDPNLAFSYTGADQPDIRNRESAPPLVWAARLHLPEAMKLLLEAGADPNGQDSNGKTALSSVVSFGSDWEKFAKLDSVSAHKHRRETIQLLKSYGVNPNLRDNINRNALHSCLPSLSFSGTIYDPETGTRTIEHEAFEWLRELINTGIDQTALDSEGNPPICHLYAPSGPFMKLLHEVGLTVGVRTKHGNFINTLIDHFRWVDGEDRYSCIAYLLECGLDPNIPNQYGKTVVESIGDPELCLLLAKNGALPAETALDTFHYQLEIWEATSLYERYRNADPKDRSVLEKAFDHLVNATKLDKDNYAIITLASDIIVDLDETDDQGMVLKKLLYVPERDDREWKRLCYRIETSVAQSLYVKSSRDMGLRDPILRKAFKHIWNALKLDRNDEGVIRLTFDILADLGDAKSICAMMNKFIKDAYDHNGWGVWMEPVHLLDQTLTQQRLRAILADSCRAARVLYGHRQFEKALKVYDATYKSRPDNLGPRANFSIQDALRYAHAALTSKSNMKLIHIARVKDEVAAHPRSEWLHFYLGRLHFLHDESIVDAELEFHAAIELDRSAKTPAREWLARAYLKQELFEEAIQVAIEDTECRPNVCTAWGVLGTAYACKGSYLEAHSAFRRSLQANPTYELGQKQLKQIEERLG